MNNKDNIDNDTTKSSSLERNTIWNVFIGLFLVVILIGIICLSVTIFKCIKSKKLFKKLFKNKYTENTICTYKNEY